MLVAARAMTRIRRAGNIRMVIIPLLLLLSFLSASTGASASLVSASVYSPDSHIHGPSAASHDFGFSPLLQSRQSEKPQLSKNGRCGERSDEGNGWRCPTTIEEQAVIDGKGTSADSRKLELKCCSAQGFCGGSAAHCGEFRFCLFFWLSSMDLVLVGQC